MQFSKRLRPLIRDGSVTTSIRIWQRPRVKVGGRYRMADGEVVVTKIREIGFDDITPVMARASGFAGVAELLKTAKHGTGERVYLIEFVFEENDD